MAVAVLTLLSAPLRPSGAAPAPEPARVVLDPTFGRDGKVIATPPVGAEEAPGGQALMSDGRIVVAGIAFPGRSGRVFSILRFTPDGLPDESFGRHGRVWTDLATLSTPSHGEVLGPVALGASGANAVAVLADGRILAGGYTQSDFTTAFALVRYLPDGRPDPSFGTDGVVVTDFDPLANGAPGVDTSHPAGTDDAVTALSVGPDGRILAAGLAGDAAALARYRPDGAPDTTFGPDRSGAVVTRGGLLNVLALAADPAGRVLVAGQAGIPGGPFDFGLARYSPDGVPDDSFGDRGVVQTDIGATGEWASGVTAGPGGTVVATGASGSAFALARYRADGSPDRSFGTAGIVHNGPELGGANALVPLADGRLVLVGEILVNGERQLALARYRPDGAIDAAFGDGGMTGTDVIPGRHENGGAGNLSADGRLLVTGVSLDEDNLHPVIVLCRYTGVAV